MPHLLFGLVLFFLSLIVLAPSSAMAFCGFYASSADTTSKLTNDATQVVLLRHQTRTVLSMRNTYKGPLQDFAMVIPVPVVLKKEQVKTLDDAAFDKINLLGAPRLVQYWESDPCKKRYRRADSSLYFLEGRAMGKGGSASLGNKRTMVTVEAQFKQGEYDIAILSAKDSNGLEKWLKANKYNIPKGASKVLKPYVQQGMYFFVAKVDIKRVKARVINNKPQHILSPLRFHYESKAFSLPVRLGLLNANGMQDLIIHILAKSRYEVANAKNVTIPTNLVVDKSVLKNFGAFYNQLFDFTLKQHPGAVVTEYAWESTKCDPCPTGSASGVGGPLTTQDLTTFGLDAIYPQYGKGGTQIVGKVTYFGGTPPAKHGPLEGTLLTRARFCSRMLQRNQRTGEVMVRVLAELNPGGQHLISTQLRQGKHGLYTACLRRRLGSLNAQQLAQIGVSKPVKASFLLRARVVRSPRQITQGWVLTRLHTRYNAKTLKNDLVFKTAPSIVGGRGTPVGPRGKLSEEGALPSRFNQFQGRYVVLNRWKGKKSCRNAFGGWDGASRERPRGAQNLAFTPRKKGKLASLIKSKNKPGLPWYKPKTRKSSKSP